MREKANIELFDEITARIFSKLYENFPIPSYVDCVKLTNSPDIDEEGETTREAEVCIESLKWLKEEGYIKYNNQGQFDAYEIQLTGKGLSILKSTPESIKDRKTLGDRLMLAVNAGSITASVEVMKLILGGWK